MPKYPSIGYVYVLLYPSSHPASEVQKYKIGFGESAEVRHRQLQRTCPGRIYLVKSVRVRQPRQFEKYLQDLYGTKKDRSGEYFCLVDADLLRIGELMADASEAQQERAKRDFGNLIK